MITNEYLSTKALSVYEYFKSSSNSKDALTSAIFTVTRRVSRQSYREEILCPFRAVNKHWRIKFFFVYEKKSV